MKNKLLMFTNIFPYPWAESRGRFNNILHQHLDEHIPIEVLVPVPFVEFFKHLSKIINNKDSRVSYFPFFYLPGLFRALNPFFMVFSIIVAVRPLVKLLRHKQVFCSWGYPDAPGLAMLQPFCRFKLYVHCLGSDINVHMNYRVRKFLLKNAFERSEVVFTVSEDLRSKVLAISPSSTVHTVYNGVDFEQFKIKSSVSQANSDKHNSSINLLFIGNLIKEKGVVELANVYPRLKQTFPKLTLTVVGQGPLKSALESKLQQWLSSSDVSFTGALSHDKVAEHLSHSGVLVLPSYSEGVPNVIMEAVASGVPVVATKVGGIPEIVNSENGTLIPAKDENALYDGICSLLSKEWRPEAIRQSVLQYTWKNKVNLILEQLDIGGRQENVS